MQSRNRAEWIILIIMRVLGVGAMLAIPAIFFPFSWMDSIHRYCGLGELPDVPIVHYLARSLSTFYAIVGAIALFMSRDIRANRPFVHLWGWLIMTTGFVMLGIDLAAGMPVSWTVAEGPPTILCGLLVVWLRQHIPVEPSQVNSADSQR